MKRRLRKVFNLILILIITNVLITEFSKQYYSEDAAITYFWFDLSNYLRYVVYDLILLCFLFILTIPVEIRVLMITYTLLSVKDTVMYAYNGNTGSNMIDGYILIISVLFIVYKSVLEKNKRQNKIIPDDLNHIYRISKPSRSLLSTLLWFIGEDSESVKYYAYRFLYKFDKQTDEFVKIKCDPWELDGNIEKIPCNSVKFSILMDKKLQSKYNKFTNNCESVTNEAKEALGIKTRKFPQLNI